jgi:hypothetical protein
MAKIGKFQCCNAECCNAKILLLENGDKLLNGIRTRWKDQEIINYSTEILLITLHNREGFSLLLCLLRVTSLQIPQQCKKLSPLYAADASGEGDF